MRQVREVLRLRWACGCSVRQSALRCGVSRPAVDEYVRRAVAAGLSWPLPAALDDATLADAILDRLVHNAYRLELKGESLRKRQKRLTDSEASNT